jgi:voltage-gated potassium channel Kch
VRPTLRQRIRYAFDNTMSRGTPALVGYLALATAALIAIGVLAVLLGGFTPANGRHSFIGAFFTTLTHAIDPGTLANDTARWPFLLAMLMVTIGGLFVFSALIGVLATGLEGRLTELRKGRSLVLERGHTLILGWSDQVFTILSELAEAKESEPRPSAVILADEDKVEMEDRIRVRLRHRHRHLRIICRSGSPIDLADLEIVNPREARSIIVLGPDADEPDSHVIKTVLALTHAEAHLDWTYHIVAEIEDPENLGTAQLVGGAEAVFVDKRETIARLIVQAARQSGVSAVMSDLLDFAGDELYVREDPALVGKRFSEALFAYEACSVVGLVSAAGGVELNPSAEREITAGTSLIAIAEDDAALADAAPCEAAVDEGAIHDGPTPTVGPERTLILGWNTRGPSVVRELDHYVKPGSRVEIVADSNGPASLTSGREPLANLELDVRRASTTDRRVLDELGVPDCDRVIVLCYSDELDAQPADARTLVTLLHLRDICDRADAQVSIVSEMVDDRNRELAETARIDDVIVSDRLVSLMLAQISENSHLREVFTDLLDAEGSELYLKRLDRYLVPGRETTYASAVASAMRRGEAAVGFRRASGDDGRALIRLNPPKSETLVPADGDTLIVLAED